MVWNMDWIVECNNGVECGMGQWSGMIDYSCSSVWHQLTFPYSSSHPLSSLKAYYHPNLLCIKSQWPCFTPHQLVIPPSIHAKLLPQQWDYVIEYLACKRTDHELNLY